MKEDAYAHCFNTGHKIEAAFSRGEGFVSIDWSCTECDAADIDEISDDPDA